MVIYQGLLPSWKRRGPRRVDDRRVISGISHMLQSGMRWRDCPKEYGPPTTISNRSITAGIAGRSRDCGKGCSMS
jgi:transposase